MIGEYCNVQNQLAKIMIDEIFHVLKWHKWKLFRLKVFIAIWWIEVYICIGGDLEGWIVRLDKARFNAREIHRGKVSNYTKQKYIIGKRVFCFWRHTEMGICDATRRIELILQNKFNWFENLITATQARSFSEASQMVYFCITTLIISIKKSICWDILKIQYLFCFSLLLEGYGIPFLVEAPCWGENQLE